MIYVVIGLVVYGITGLIWFIKNMGRKNGPDRWYDYVFGPGMYLWFPFIWLIRTCITGWKKWLF
jgi:hypothetical protein